MPYPLICIEGPDCVGKSTLAKDLGSRINAKYMHATYRFKGRMPLYHLAYFRQALKYAQHQPVIMDRWYPSEYAYGNVFRSGAEDHQYWRYLQRLALRYAVSFVWCVPHRLDVYMDFMKKNYHNEKQLYPKMETMALVWQQYRDWTTQYRYNFHSHLNYAIDSTAPFFRKADTSKFIIDSIKAYLSTMPKERKELMWSECMDYSGNVFNPGTLVRMPPRTSKLWTFETSIHDAYGIHQNEQIYGWVNRSDHPDAQRVMAIARENAVASDGLIIDSDNHAAIDRLIGDVKPLEPAQRSLF
jgi:hypothetical protein